MLISRLSTDACTECEDRARILETEFAIRILVIRKVIKDKRKMINWREKWKWGKWLGLLNLVVIDTSAFQLTLRRRRKKK